MCLWIQLVVVVIKIQIRLYASHVLDIIMMENSVSHVVQPIHKTFVQLVLDMFLLILSAINV